MNLQRQSFLQEFIKEHGEQVEHRGGKHGRVTVVAAGQAPHHRGGTRSIVLRPPVCRIGVINIDAGGKPFHLAFERDSSPAVPFADFHAKQVITPPGGLGGVRVLAASRNCDETAPAEQQQITVDDLRPGVGECDEMKRAWRHSSRHTPCAVTEAVWVMPFFLVWRRVS
jgi:hypothetical protein